VHDCGVCRPRRLSIGRLAAQSLGDVAKKEGERRQARRLGKTYTNNDLQPGSSGPAPHAGGRSLSGDQVGLFDLLVSDVASARPSNRACHLPCEKRVGAFDSTINRSIVRSAATGRSLSRLSEGTLHGGSDCGSPTVRRSTYWLLVVF
jgi:hypothetical protein